MTVILSYEKSQILRARKMFMAGVGCTEAKTLTRILTIGTDVCKAVYEGILHHTKGLSIMF